MSPYESPNWTGPPPPPHRSLRIAFSDWFARWGFVLLTLFFLALVAAAALVLPGLRAARVGLPTTPVSDVRPGGLPSADGQSGVTDTRYVNISSVPAGARVSIDVDSVGVTPLYLHAIEASVHLLTLEKDGYKRVDTLLYGQATDTSSFLFVLRPAQLDADEGLIASTDSPEPTREPQREVAPVRDPRAREPQVREPQVREAPVRSADAEPANDILDTPRRPPAPALGSLTVSSDPIGATVLLDGVDIGQTPTSLGDVTPGDHNVRIRLNGFDDYEATVGISAGQSSVVSATLIEALGEIAVLVRPWGSIYIDGRLMKRDIDVEFSTTIPAGQHTVVATHPTLGRVTRTINVRPGQTERIVFDLNDRNVRTPDS